MSSVNNELVLTPIDRLHECVNQMDRRTKAPNGQKIDEVFLKALHYLCLTLNEEGEEEFIKSKSFKRYIWVIFSEISKLNDPKYDRYGYYIQAKLKMRVSTLALDKFHGFFPFNSSISSLIYDYAFPTLAQTLIPFGCRTYTLVVAEKTPLKFIFDQLPRQRNRKLPEVHAKSTSNILKEIFGEKVAEKLRIDSRVQSDTDVSLWKDFENIKLQPYPY